jgi:uncharacterized protein
MSPELERAKFVSLVTFRKDGREVATPVSPVVVDGKLMFYSVKNQGKVKRIRATKRVRVAPCTMRGKVTGAWVEGTGRIVTEPDLMQRMKAALIARYGLFQRVYDFLSWVARREGKRDVIELTLP